MESTTSKRELQPQRESGTRDSIWAHYQVEEADLTISEPPRYEIIQGRIPTVGSTSSQRRNALETEDDDILVPIRVPLGYPPLDAKPVILQNWSMTTILLFNILALVGVCLLHWLTDDKHQFHTSFANTPSMIRYVPSLIGTITTVAGRSMHYAYSRLDPYLVMADRAEGSSLRDVGGERSVGVRFGIFIFFRKNWWRNAFFINGFCLSFITALKAGFMSTSATATGWTVTVSPAATKSLIAIYIGNSCLLLALLLFLWKRTTGLKWDPTTIADQLALFYKSNVLSDFAELEFEGLHYMQAFKDLFVTPNVQLTGNNFRLGYWERGATKKLLYGIGRIELPKVPNFRPRDDDAGQTRDPTGQSNSQCLDENPACDSSLTCPSNDHQLRCARQQSHCASRNPYRVSSMYHPWGVCTWQTIIILALVACITGLAQRVVRDGFTMNNYVYCASCYANNTNTTDNPRNFVNITSKPWGTGLLEIGIFESGTSSGLTFYIFFFRVVLVFVASAFAVIWMEGMDLGIRLSEPFANMHRKGASVSNSLTLDYLWGISIDVTIQAIKNQQWKVAWFSFLGQISTIFPVLVGGLFTMTNTGHHIVFNVHSSPFYLVFAFLIIFALSLPFAWPRAKRRLPRNCSSIADLMSLFYASKIMENGALDISGKNVEKKHLDSRLFLQEETFQAGLFVGVDGKMHFGVDYHRLRMNGQEIEHVGMIGKIKRQGSVYLLEREHDKDA